jgi:hypothetical protein
MYGCSNFRTEDGNSVYPSPQALGPLKSLFPECNFHIPRLCDVTRSGVISGPTRAQSNSFHVEVRANYRI